MAFEGPRTIRYFAFLLLLTVCLFVLGAILSKFYGFSLLENLTQGFVENPMTLLDIAGAMAFIVQMGIVARYAVKFSQ